MAIVIFYSEANFYLLNDLYDLFQQDIKSEFGISHKAYSKLLTIISTLNSELKMIHIKKCDHKCILFCQEAVIS